MNELGSRLLLLLAGVCTVVGAVDSAVGRQWDLLVIFAVTMALLVTLWLRERLHRISVTLRPDLAHWLEHRAESSGEPFDDVLDRAVATFKHGLITDDRPVDEGR